MYYSRPVIPLLLSLMAGILAGLWLPDFRMWGYALALTGTAGVLCAVVCQTPLRFTPLLLIAACGYLSIQPWATQYIPDHRISRFATADIQTITGTLISAPSAENQRQKFDIRCEYLQNKEQPRFPVSGNIRVTVDGALPELNMGDRIRLSGRIRELHNFKNPGGFDYRQYMIFNGIHAAMFVGSKDIVRDVSGHHSSVLETIQRVRQKISHNIDAIGDHEERAVLKALLIGDTREIPKQVTDIFSRDGISHLLAISGLHVGIVATSTFFVFQWILSRFQFFLWRAWTRKGAALLSFLPVLAYGLLAGMSPSTQRAVIMISVFLMSFLVQREPEAFNTLSLAALVILVIHPPALFSISFQLSFASVFSILFILPRLWPLPDIFFDGHQNFRRMLLSPLWVSLSASIGTLLLVVYYFNQISLISPIANYVIVPLVGFGVVPLGLLSAAISLIAPGLALWGMQFCAMLLGIALYLARFFAALPWAAIQTISPSILEMICGYVLLFALIALRPGQSFKLPVILRKSAHRVPKTFKKRMRAVATIAALVLGIDAGYWGYQRFIRSDLRVTVIDVGQGTASLLEFPKGTVMLIDAGGFSEHTAFDVGKMVVAPLLWQKKIRSVDILTLSHTDSDHLSGMIYIADHFHVREVWTNGEAADSIGYHRFMEVLERRRLLPVNFSTFPRRREIGGVLLEIVNPPPDFLARSVFGESWRDTNNNSLAVRVALGHFSMLFPGDIKTAAENEMLVLYGNRLQSQVLVVPHHGSKSSCLPAFVDAVHPQMAIFTTGVNNRFKFPHSFVIEQYQRVGAELRNTAADGAVMIVADGRNMQVTSTIFRDVP
jgi:competence protein ComEC